MFPQQVIEPDPYHRTDAYSITIFHWNKGTEQYKNTSYVRNLWEFASQKVSLYILNFLMNSSIETVIKELITSQ